MSANEHVYQRPSHHYADGVETVSVVHERGRGIAWRIWPGAHVLLDWLEKHRAEWLVNPCHCVEIGAGVGLVGVVCAGLGAAKVTLTDLPEELHALERSMVSNTESVRDRLGVMPMAFGVSSDIDAVVASSPTSPPHQLVVVGSELVYWETLFVPIAETLRDLVIKHHGVAYIGYRKRVWKTEKRFFTKVLKQFGLDSQVMGQWMAVEDDGASQKTDGQVVYRESTPGVEADEEEWNTRVYRIFPLVQKVGIEMSFVDDEVVYNKYGKPESVGRKGKGERAPEVVVVDSPPTRDKKKTKIVRQEKKGRVR